MPGKTLVMKLFSGWDEVGHDSTEMTGEIGANLVPYSWAHFESEGRHGGLSQDTRPADATGTARPPAVHRPGGRACDRGPGRAGRRGRGRGRRRPARPRVTPHRARRRAGALADRCG